MIDIRDYLYTQTCIFECLYMYIVNFSPFHPDFWSYPIFFCWNPPSQWFFFSMSFCIWPTDRNYGCLHENGWELVYWSMNSLSVTVPLPDGSSPFPLPLTVSSSQEGVGWDLLSPSPFHGEVLNCLISHVSVYLSFSVIKHCQANLGGGRVYRLQSIIWGSQGKNNIAYWLSLWLAQFGVISV